MKRYIPHGLFLIVLIVVLYGAYGEKIGWKFPDVLLWPYYKFTKSGPYATA